MAFRKATRRARKARISLIGVSGSGKTWTALEIAKGLSANGKIAFVDTENSADMYAGDFDFDILQLKTFDVGSYTKAITDAATAGYDVVILDSLTHAWQHLLEEKANIVKRGSRNDYTAWDQITPIYKALLNSIIRAPIHVIVCMRQKSDVILEEYTDNNGRTRTRPVKKGLKAEFREGGEYEFDLVATIDIEHNLIVEKTRMKFLTDRVVHKPDSSLGKEIKDWLDEAPEELPPTDPLDHVIKTDCAQYGKTVREVVETQQPWLIKVLSSEAARAKLHAEDLKNLTLANTQKESTNGNTQE
jgi:hypothetical protein